MKTTRYTDLIQYLKTELSLSEKILRDQQDLSSYELDLLPIKLWQNGLLTVKQLEQVFDWLSDQYTPSQPA